MVVVEGVGGTEVTSGGVSDSRNSQPSGAKLIYVNNVNRVICTATTVLTDKGQVPILSAWRKT